MAQVLMALGTWFVAALAVGVALGKTIAARDRAAHIEAPTAEQPGVHRAA